MNLSDSSLWLTISLSLSLSLAWRLATLRLGSDIAWLEDGSSWRELLELLPSATPSLATLAWGTSISSSSTSEDDDGEGCEAIILQFLHSYIWPGTGQYSLVEV